MFNDPKYYMYGELITKQRILNFILSLRSGGKTYGAKLLGIRDYIKFGKEFIYLRRYDSEIRQNLTDNFFSVIEINEEFPDYEFKVYRKKGLIKKKSEKDWHTLCYFVSLSTAGSHYKSIDFPRVKKVFFDEFSINENTNMRYLNNEPTLLLEFYETIDRKRDEVEFFLLGNNLSLVNPYFEYFDLDVNLNQRFNYSKNGKCICEIFNGTDEMLEHNRNTRFGNLIKNTEYGDYCLYNKALNDNTQFICKKPKGIPEFLCSFINDTREMGLWLYPDMIFVDDKINDTSKERYVFLRDNQTVNTKFINSIKGTPKIKLIKTFLNDGKIYYKDAETKKYFYDCNRIFY